MPNSNIEQHIDVRSWTGIAYNSCVGTCTDLFSDGSFSIEKLWPAAGVCPVCRREALCSAVQVNLGY